MWSNGGYGYFRDELYFLACGDHLAWGYADMAPMVALGTSETKIRTARSALFAAGTPLLSGAGIWFPDAFGKGLQGGPSKAVSSGGISWIEGAKRRAIENDVSPEDAMPLLASAARRSARLLAGIISFDGLNSACTIAPSNAKHFARGTDVINP